MTSGRCRGRCHRRLPDTERCRSRTGRRRAVSAGRRADEFPRIRRSCAYRPSWLFRCVGSALAMAVWRSEPRTRVSSGRRGRARLPPGPRPRGRRRSGSRPGTGPVEPARSAAEGPVCSARCGRGRSRARPTTRCVGRTAGECCPRLAGPPGVRVLMVKLQPRGLAAPTAVGLEGAPLVVAVGHRAAPRAGMVREPGFSGARRPRCVGLSVLRGAQLCHEGVERSRHDGAEIRRWGSRGRAARGLGEALVGRPVDRERHRERLGRQRLGARNARGLVRLRRL